MTPKVSIVVPVYKVSEKMLRACIESCMKQSEQNIEIVLVDDCTPDNGGAICDEYAKRDNRIKVVHKEKNGGLSAARNTGVKAAVGEWITFLDGDDWIEQETCSYVNKIADSEVELAFFGILRDYGNSSQELTFCYEDHKIFDAEECKQLQIDVLNYSKRLATAYGKFVKREFLQKSSIFHDEEVRCGIEGIEYNFRLFGHIKKAMSFKAYLYHYVYNLDSITGAPSEVTNGFILLGLERINQYISTVNENERLIRQFEDRVQRVIMDTSIGCYFNPNYKLNYKERKQNLNEFCSRKVIAEVLEKPCHASSKMKKIICFCTKHRLYFMLSVLGYIRIKILGSR